MCVMCDLNLRIRSQDVSAAIKMGSMALAAYFNDQSAASAMLIDTAYRDFGRDGLAAITGDWCELVLTRTLGRTRGTPVYLVWEDVTTGKISYAPDTPPLARWAGRYIASVAAADPDMTQALFNALPDDDRELAEYVGALAQSLLLHLKAAKADGAA